MIVNNLPRGHALVRNRTALGCSAKIIMSGVASIPAMGQHHLGNAKIMWPIPGMRLVPLFCRTTLENAYPTSCL